MPTTIFQSAINISEGRDLSWIESLVKSLKATNTLWDYSSDQDHNRSVITLGGTLSEICSTLTIIYEQAAHLMLEKHRGVHPRYGIIDVVPFTPLNKPIEEVAWSQIEASLIHIADRFQVPGYTYDWASSSHRALPETRLAIKNNEPPSFGPIKPHPTLGVTCFALRSPLVAFNMILDSCTLEQAKQLAQKMRESHSGLVGVRALAFYLESRQRYQISLNLTQPDKTSPLSAFQHLVKIAAQESIQVIESELIGLAKAEYLWDCIQEQLKLKSDNTVNQVLECAALSRLKYIDE